MLHRFLLREKMKKVGVVRVFVGMGSKDPCGVPLPPSGCGGGSDVRAFLFVLTLRYLYHRFYRARISGQHHGQGPRDRGPQGRGERGVGSDVFFVCFRGRRLVDCRVGGCSSAQATILLPPPPFFGSFFSALPSRDDARGKEREWWDEASAVELLRI